MKYNLKTKIEFTISTRINFKMSLLGVEEFKPGTGLVMT